jgi:hypothetical protein
MSRHIEARDPEEGTQDDDPHTETPPAMVRVGVMILAVSLLAIRSPLSDKGSSERGRVDARSPSITFEEFLSQPVEGGIPDSLSGDAPFTIALPSHGLASFDCIDAAWISERRVAIRFSSGVLLIEEPPTSRTP